MRRERVNRMTRVGRRRRIRAARVRLASPWRRIHGAIWLLGIAVLAVTHWWWPGILVLVALSMVVEAGLSTIPGATVAAEPDPLGMASSAAPREHNPARLPERCQACGAPVEPAQTQWTSAVTARCSYCGANLQMKS
jgi:hypothetical protein